MTVCWEFVTPAMFWHVACAGAILFMTYEIVKVCGPVVIHWEPGEVNGWDDVPPLPFVPWEIPFKNPCHAECFADRNRDMAMCDLEVDPIMKAWCEFGVSSVYKRCLARKGVWIEGPWIR